MWVNKFAHAIMFAKDILCKHINMEMCNGFVYGVDDQQLDKQTSMFHLHCPEPFKNKKEINKEFSAKILTNHNPFTSWLQGFLKGDFLK